MVDGYIDTNVFLHAQAHDEHTAACRTLLRAVGSGQVTAWVDPLVLHELTYVLPRYVQGMTRSDVALYLRTVLSWPGTVLDDKAFWVDVVDLWEVDARLSWTDAVLIRRAQRTGRGIWTRNVRDFARHDMAAPLWP
ncbi:MAG: type II toxin-antitoxin system VapC family toxin [Actinomycetia bacterium]|nr:type II toxin-antitoxin system VapC family toxin [Actinomycetes bacterium]